MQDTAIGLGARKEPLTAGCPLPTAVRGRSRPAESGRICDRARAPVNGDADS